MNTPERSLLNDRVLLAERDRHFDRLRAIFSGETPETPFFLNGIAARPSGGNPSTGFSEGARIDPYTAPEVWMEAALVSLAACADSLRDTEVFRPLCVEFGPYGVHYIDKMLGARVYASPDRQWWVDYVDHPVGELTAPDLETDPTWALSRRLARAFLEAHVSVPLFGMPTIASALNIAVNLYGPDLLVAFYESPDAVRHDLDIINSLLCRLHAWYRAHIPEAQLQPVVAAQRCQPPGSGQLCGCTTHLVSAATYREFVAPLDDALLSIYPHGGMIHLCGAHTQHIPVWKEMRSLRAVQLNDRAAEDFEAYYEGLRDDQVLYINPTPSVTVEAVLARTGGRRVVLVVDPSPNGH